VSRAWHAGFVYASLAFVALALYRADYLSLPDVRAWGPLLASLPCQLAGFALAAAGWARVLRGAGFTVGEGESFAGLGLSVFGGYLPGRIWLVVGRAGYVAAARGHPLGKLSVLSFQAQLVALWVGLVVGVLGLVAVDGFGLWGGVTAGFLVALTLLLFSDRVHRAGQSLISALSRGRIRIPVLSGSATRSVLPWFVASWLLWVLGFGLFAAALGGDGPSLIVGLGFPLAATLGTLAVIAPGGLGAREAVLTGYLVLAGFAAADATTTAVAGRVWYLAGEAAVFIAGWTVHAGLRRAAP
jgi:hypothetical protein